MVGDNHGAVMILPLRRWRRRDGDEVASPKGKKMVSIKSLAVESLPADLQLLANQLLSSGALWVQSLVPSISIPELTCNPNLVLSS